MPFPRCYNGLVAVGPRLWIVGGSANLRSPDDRDGPRDPLDSVLIYDILENRWENAPPLHEARIEPVVILARGRIYAAGGGDPQGNAMVTVESIAPGERSWRVEQALPAPMRQAAGCVVDERMYVCGKSGFWMFDPERGGWITALAQPPQLPQAPLMAAHQGDVWVMGGYRSRATWIYNPEENQWLSGPDLPTEQSWVAAWSLNGQIMAIAGAHWSETHGVFVFDNRVFAMKT
jgi:N-acetylneuraminic acid mutarotase